MPQTYPNYNPSGALDGQGTSVASIIGPGVTRRGEAIYLANADGTFGDEITGGGGGGSITLVESTDSSVTVTGGTGPTVDLSIANITTTSGIVFSDTNDSSGIVLTENGAGGFTIADTNVGILISETGNGAGIEIDVGGSGTGNLSLQVGPGATGGIQIGDAGAGGISIEETAAANIGLLMSGTGNIVFDASGAGSGIKVGSSDTQMVGFFGATPILQPAAPVTLGDVITALTNLGLVAS